MFPRAAVGSVVGIGAFAGGIGGWAFQRVPGRILHANGNDYTPIFIVCGLAYVSAWAVIHPLPPRLRPAAGGGETRACEGGARRPPCSPPSGQSSRPRSWCSF